MFLLSLHGLRAKEIAGLQVWMVLDSQGAVGSTIALHDNASKGHSGRYVPISSTLKEKLELLLADRLEKQESYV
jgi:integrase/recombinase XerD